jgi:hypothetical protein
LVGPVDSSLQVRRSDAKLDDEKAEEALARADQKEALTGDAPTDDTPVVQPESGDNSMSYKEYVDEPAHKKLAFSALRGW